MNGPAEIERLQGLDLPVEFFPLPTDGKPRIGAILSAIRKSGARFAGIINSDCRIVVYSRNMAHNLQAGLDRRLALAWRLDTKADGASAMRYGYDAFFFDTAILPHDDAGFSIGETWWDLWFPHACETNDARVEVLKIPLLLHKAHPPDWNDAEWFAHAHRFWKIVGKEGTPSNFDIYKLATDYPATLRTRPQTIFITPPDIELALRAGTNAMFRPDMQERLYSILRRFAPRWALELLHRLRPRSRFMRLRHRLRVRTRAKVMAARLASVAGFYRLFKFDFPKRRY